MGSSSIWCSHEEGHHVVEVRIVDFDGYVAIPDNEDNTSGRYVSTGRWPGGDLLNPWHDALGVPFREDCRFEDYALR